MDVMVQVPLLHIGGLYARSGDKTLNCIKEHTSMITILSQHHKRHVQSCLQISFISHQTCILPMPSIMLVQTYSCNNSINYAFCHITLSSLLAKLSFGSSLISCKRIMAAQGTRMHATRTQQSGIASFDVILEECCHLS